MVARKLCLSRERWARSCQKLSCKSCLCCPSLSWVWAGGGGAAESPPSSCSPRSWIKSGADAWVHGSPSHSIVTSCVHGSPSSPRHRCRIHRTRATWRLLGSWCEGDGPHTARLLPTHCAASTILTGALALIVVFPSFFFLLVQRLLCSLRPVEIFSLWLTAVILGLKEITHERAAWGRKQQRQKKPRLPRERELQGFIDMRKITALASGPAADICDRFRHCSLAWNYFLTQAKRSEGGVLNRSWWSCWGPSKIKREQWELFPLLSSLPSSSIRILSCNLVSSTSAPGSSTLTSSCPSQVPWNGPQRGAEPSHPWLEGQSGQGPRSSLSPGLPVSPHHPAQRPAPGRESRGPRDKRTKSSFVWCFLLFKSLPYMGKEPKK